MYSHQLRTSSSGTGPAVAWKTSPPGTSSSGSGVRVVGRIERPLGDRDVARLADEAPELRRGHGTLVHPEPVDRDAVHGPLLRIEVLRPHQEAPALDPAHVLRRRSCGRRRSGQVASFPQARSAPGLVSAQMIQMSSAMMSSDHHG